MYTFWVVPMWESPAYSTVCLLQTTADPQRETSFTEQQYATGLVGIFEDT